MKTKIILLALLVVASTLGRSAPIGTAFTYQGRLTDATIPANGSYDFTFTLYQAASGGLPIVTVTNLNTAVSNGLFIATVDFGGGIWNGNAYWISLGVRSNGVSGGFTSLASRQPLTPTPNASYASLAGTVPGGSITSANLAVDSVTVSALQNNAVTAAKVAAGQIVKSVNGLHDDVIMSAGPNVTITPSGNTLTFGGSSDWTLAGNAGTTPGTQYLGTRDNQPLEIHVNGVRALRIEPEPLGTGAANLIGGYYANSASGGYGAAIAGGGTSGSPNYVLGDYGFIGAGHGARAGQYSAVVGGAYNDSSSQFSFIGSGLANTNLADYSFIGTGSNNVIQAGSIFSLIGGGRNNSIRGNSQDVTISGGYQNFVGTNAGGATIGGGYLNSIADNAGSSTIGGGWANQVSDFAVYSVIGGGYLNTNNGGYATVGGGALNTSSGYYATVGGGQNNTSSGYSATVGGGQNNTSSGDSATVGGGQNNTSSGDSATVPGGYLNNATGIYSFAAGNRAKANHKGSFVWADSQTTDFASTTNDQFSIRAKGGVRVSDDTANLSFGTTLRQMLNLWGTQYAIGVQSYTLYFRTDNTFPGGGFAWYQGGTHSDSKTDSGGGITMMTLDNSGLRVNGTFVSSSDRNVKENFKPISAQEILQKVVALPLTRWNYKADANTPHLGPMAQDFYAAFNVGPDDKHITVIDEGGVALAAIQGLNQKLEAKNAEIESLKQSVAELKQLVQTFVERK